jgi:hypothetical protein
MLNLDPDAALACEDCGGPLGPADHRLTMATDAGERRAYECACGAVTVTVVREG